MISALYIISSRGDVLSMEKYRNDVPQEQLNEILAILLKTKCGVSSPCIKHNGICGYYIRREKLFYLIVTKREMPSIVILTFLDSFYGLIQNFCGGATEDFIRRNLILVHELMTECVDNGVIKTTNTEQLRPVIYTDPAIIKLSQSCEVKKHGPFGLERKCISNTASERPLVKSRSQQSIKRAEVFVDVVEKLTAHFGKEGVVDRFYLYGVIQMKSFVTLNHSVTINLDTHFSSGGSRKDDISEIRFDKFYFDKCVEAKDFEKLHTFVVRPSQEQISAMSYHIESFIPVHLPFRLSSVLEESQINKDCDLTLKLSCNIESNAEVLNLSLHIPVSSSTRNIMQQFSMFDNTAEFLSKERKILWKIKKLPGRSEVIAKFKLIDAIQCPANHLEMGPVALEFEASNYTCSGLQIKNLKAEDPSGKPIAIQKWVRYVTLADSYVFKL